MKAKAHIAHQTIGALLLQMQNFEGLKSTAQILSKNQVIERVVGSSLRATGIPLRGSGMHANIRSSVFSSFFGSNS